jgi:hypothetical protein
VDEKRKMKGKALVMVGILVLVLGVATFGPIQVAAAYEHNWSWMLPEPGETFNPNVGWWG